jgi:hypothetical protein
MMENPIVPATDNKAAKKNRIIIWVVVGVVVLCLGTCVAGWLGITYGAQFMAVEDPSKVSAMANEALDFTLPSGYSPQMAMNMVFMKMMIFTRGTSVDTGFDSGPMIMIASMAEGISGDSESFRTQMQASMGQAASRNGMSITLIDTGSISVRGQTVTLYVFEGTDEQGGRIREIMSDLFQGKNGNVIIMIMGDPGHWNQAEINRFLQSIE